MIIPDFLIYYLAKWYEKHPEKLSWSTPVERACYIVGLTTIFLFFGLGEIFDIFILRSAIFLKSEIPFIAAGLLSMLLYNYIYIKQARYAAINSSGKNFGVSEKRGTVLAIISVFVSAVIPIGIFMIFTD